MKSKLKPAFLQAAIVDIEARFLSGSTLSEVREVYRETSLPMSHVAKYRNALFDRLNNNPQAVKDLANGPLLNANKIVRYSGMRRALKSKAYQESILDVCDGSMNGAT
jgi:hypothetical protein